MILSWLFLLSPLISLPDCNGLCGINENTWILIDIGDTLVYHTNPLVYKEHLPWVNRWFEENAPDLSKEEIQSLMISIKNDNDSWVFTDPKWPSFIQEVRQKGAKVAAFSKMIPDPGVRKARQQRLKDLGVDFSTDIPLQPSPAYIYENGVIETSLNWKGDCLVEIFKSIQPERIVFIENEKKQLESVERVCEERGIPCTPIHCQESPKPMLDPQRADRELRLVLHRARLYSFHLKAAKGNLYRQGSTDDTEEFDP